ncbi:hypothetical protein H0H92_015757 [Tricholoma furcatifolium]|nr:hypothetical protein H0H92_015757 [Tricholoma furcatifolium]
MRIQHLDVNTGHYGMNLNRENRKRHLDLLTLLDRPAPMMGYLKITLPGLEHDDSLRQIATLAGCTRLKHLTLEGCNLTWKPPTTFEHLRFLRVSAVPRDTQPSIHQLLSVLSHMPLLETLFFVATEESSTTFPTLPQVVLTHLKYINISCSTPSALYFFDHLVFPRTVEYIKVTLTETPGLRHADFEFAKKIATSFANDLAQKVDGGKDFVTKLRLGRRMGLWRSNVSTTLTPEKSTPAILDLRHLSTLTVTPHVHLTVDDWLLFAVLPHLQTLSVLSHQETLVEVLQRSLTAKMDDRAFTSLGWYHAFPALKDLTISGWNMRSLTVSQLAHVLSLRNDGGCGLNVLRVVKSKGLRNFDWSKLSSVVDEIFWDNCGETETEVEDDEEESEDDENSEDEYLWDLWDDLVEGLVEGLVERLVERFVEDNENPEDEDDDLAGEEDDHDEENDDEEDDHEDQAEEEVEDEENESNDDNGNSGGDYGNEDENTG